MGEKSNLVIYVTKDYDEFHYMEGNRPIDANHAKKLATKMKERDLRTPIIVNQKMEIVDGQHRVEALRALGKPVYYIIRNGVTLNDVQELNLTQKGWTTKDYLESYLARDVKGYATYRDFRDLYPSIPHSEALRILAGPEYWTNKKDTLNNFREGTIIISDDIGAVLMVGRHVQELVNVFPRGNTRSLICALLHCMRHVDGFDFNHLLLKCRKYPNKLHPCANVDEYLHLLEHVYNFHSKAGKLYLRKL